MNCRLAFAALVSLGLLFAPAAVRAHHSFSAAFDETKPVTVTGVMAEIKIENPHSWFYVNVTDEAGKVTKWGFEGNTPTSLMRAGYKRDALKVGDKVTVKGVHARDMTVPMGAAREIILEDGRSFIVGPKGAADAN
jgi:uncharacterized protein DUF6152